MVEFFSADIVFKVCRYRNCNAAPDCAMTSAASLRDLDALCSPSAAITCKYKRIQSTLVISNSKGLSEILRDIRTSTYQTCRIEEKQIRLTTFNKYMCNLTPEVRDILKILWKRGEIAP